MIVFRMALIALFGALVAACNTVEGAGQDLSAGGDAISDTAREVEEDL